MKNRLLMRMICLLCMCFMLCGCAAKPSAPIAGVTLPPVESKWTAPENDVNLDYSKVVMLYLPSLDGTRLVAVPASIQLSAARHHAESLCNLLLSFPGTDTTVSLGEGVLLRLSETDPVEISGNVATVNLSASALRLSHEQLFTVGQALANTLCQFGDLQYVNVLIAGVQPGLDIAATLPAGCFQANTREDLSTLWARASAPKTAARRALTAALYYPAPAGKGILCEARTLSFEEISIPSMAETLLKAISAGAESLPNMPGCPDLMAYSVRIPEMTETGGKRRLVLYFDNDLNAALLESGVTRSVMMAALTCTMTTFLPGLDGIEVHIGNEHIQSLSPSGTYTGVGETIAFPDGLMQRKHFGGFLLTHCTLYFANEQGKLVSVSRPVPFYSACNPRMLLGQMMLGPQPIDHVTGLKGVLPQGLRDADLLGVSFQGDTMILNFSSRLQELCQGMDSGAESRMVYAMVNTLAELPGVKKVCFYIMGRQPETFAGSIFLPGEFMPNLNIVE